MRFSVEKLATAFSIVIAVILIAAITLVKSEVGLAGKIVSITLLMVGIMLVMRVGCDAEPAEKERAHAPHEAAE